MSSTTEPTARLRFTTISLDGHRDITLETISRLPDILHALKTLLRFSEADDNCGHGHNTSNWAIELAQETWDSLPSNAKTLA